MSREVVMVCKPVRWHRLPLLDMAWLDDRPRDVCGRRRSRATFPSFRKGLKPHNAGRTFPATPPTESEVLRMLDCCPDNPAWRRMRALLVLLWRSGLRVSEALALERSDLDPVAGTVRVLKGKGGKYRVVGMDPWAFEQIAPWLQERELYPPGPVFPIVEGPTKGQRWASSGVRAALHKLAVWARVPHRVAPHQLRHALAVSLAREGQPIIYVSRQLGHSNVGTTATYLAGISNEEVVQALHARSAPVRVAA